MKKVIALILTLITISCGTNPEKRFTALNSAFQENRQITFIFDDTMLKDVKGSDPGIDIPKHNTEVPALAEQLVGILKSKGYNIDKSMVSTGFFLDYKKNYIKFEQEKSLNEKLAAPMFYSGAESFKPELVQQLDLLTQGAQKTNHNKYKGNIASSSKKRKVKPIPLPDMHDNFDIVIFVRASSGDVGMGKSIGTGIATGILSAVLTGGTMIYTGMPVSAANAELIIYDSASKQVLWYDRYQPQGGGKRGGSQSVATITTAMARKVTLLNTTSIN